jgi:hypothetical protein
MLVRENQKTCTGRSFAWFEGVQLENTVMNSVKCGQGEAVDSGGLTVVIQG